MYDSKRDGRWPFKQYPIAPRSTLNKINAETCRKNVGKAYEKKLQVRHNPYTPTLCSPTSIPPTSVSHFLRLCLPQIPIAVRPAGAYFALAERRASPFAPRASLSGLAWWHGCFLRLVDRLRRSSLPLRFLPGGGFSLFVGWRHHFFHLVARPGWSNLPFRFLSFACWNIRINKDEDSELIDRYIVKGRTFSLYTMCLRDSSGGNDRSLSPEPVLGASGNRHLQRCCLRSVISRHRLRSVISGRPLF